MQPRLSRARADNGSDIPTRADVQAQLDTLNKQKDLSATEKLVQQDLTETPETLDKIDRIKAETAQLRQKVAQAPENMRKATEALNALSDVDNDDETRKRLPRCRCASLSRAWRSCWTICKRRSPISQPITASWFRCKPSLSACRTPCTPHRNSYSRYVTV